MELDKVLKKYPLATIQAYFWIKKKIEKNGFAFCLMEDVMKICKKQGYKIEKSCIAWKISK